MSGEEGDGGRVQAAETRVRRERRVRMESVRGNVGSMMCAWVVRGSGKRKKGRGRWVREEWFMNLYQVPFVGLTSASHVQIT